MERSRALKHTQTHRWVSFFDFKMRNYVINKFNEMFAVGICYKLKMILAFTFQNIQLSLFLSRNVLVIRFCLQYAYGLPKYALPE